jgi:hypothetical protein
MNFCSERCELTLGKNDRACLAYWTAIARRLLLIRTFQRAGNTLQRPATEECVEMYSRKRHHSRATISRALRAAIGVTIRKAGLSEGEHQLHKLQRVHRFWSIIALLAMTPLAACSSNSSSNALDIQPGQIVGGATKQIDDVQPVGGFLPKPSLLQPGGNGRAALYYINNKVPLSSYNKIMLDPVEIWTSPGSKLSAVPTKQRNAAANTFYSDLFNALNQDCAMTNAPGPGTMRMKFALVDAELPNPIANTVATYTPYASTAYSLASFALNGGVGYFAGTATAEGYATDSKSGTLLWQAVDKRGGTTALVENTLDTWLDVHHAFEAWSAELAKALQKEGVCQK